MNARNQKLVTAAKSVFSRYGVSKTTMNDIAREAGVARQTLYNAYPNKEAILRAAVREFNQMTHDAVIAEWKDKTTFGDKVDVFFKHGPLTWYDAVQASPEAADLIDGMHSIASEEMLELKQEWTAIFTDLIRQHTKPGTSAHQDAEATADFLFSTSANAKYDAPDRETIVTRLAILKRAVLAMMADA